MAWNRDRRILFRDPKARRLLEDVYANGPMFRAGSWFLAQYPSGVFPKVEQDRPIKIVELGADLTRNQQLYKEKGNVDSIKWTTLILSWSHSRRGVSISLSGPK